MIVNTYVEGPIDANNYLLIDEDSDNAVLIDCSSPDEEFIEQIKQEGVKLKAILLTHGHFDHILGCNKFKETFDCDVYISEEDVEQLNFAPQMTTMLAGEAIPKVTSVNKYLKDGDILTFGNIELKAISTPGHTKGGMSYLTKFGKVFTGDTLFQGSVGRTDLFQGDFSALKHSVKDVLFNLPVETEVLPGHGPKTTIKFEKQHNEINQV